MIEANLIITRYDDIFVHLKVLMMTISLLDIICVMSVKCGEVRQAGYA